MLASDVIIESGSNEFFYLARYNTIYRFFTSEEALKNRLQNFPDTSASINVKSPHPYLVAFVQIESPNARHQVHIEDFRVFQNGDSLYVYAATRYNFYFNSEEQFGKH